MLFRCPGISLSLLEQCVDAVGQLILLSGDVELNPGPTRSQMSQELGSMTEAQLKQFNDMFTLLQGVNARTIKMDNEQSNLIKSVNEIKINQKSIQGKVTELDKRLSAVETKSTACEVVHQELVTLRQQVASLLNDNSTLKVSQSNQKL